MEFTVLRYSTPSHHFCLIDHAVILVNCDSPNYVPRQLRIKPTHAICPNCEIRWVKRPRLRKFQHLSIHDRSRWFHQIVHEPLLSPGVAVKNSNCWIKLGRDSARGTEFQRKSFQHFIDSTPHIES